METIEKGAPARLRLPAEVIRIPEGVSVTAQLTILTTLETRYKEHVHQGCCKSAQKYRKLEFNAVI